MKIIHIPTAEEMGHKLLTPETCDCDKHSDEQCPVCDWGLAVCALCGDAEVGLQTPCKPQPQPLKTP